MLFHFIALTLSALGSPLAHATSVDWKGIPYFDGSQTSIIQDQMGTLGYRSKQISILIPGGALKRNDPSLLLTFDSPWIIEVKMSQGSLNETQTVRRASIMPAFALKNFDLSRPIELNIYSPLFVSLSASWLTQDQLTTHVSQMLTLNGFYAGAISLLLIYHLMLYVMLRRRVFLSYIGVAVILCILIASSVGVMDLLVHTKPEWREIAIYLRPLPPLLMGLFVMDLFQLQKAERLALTVGCFLSASTALMVWIQGPEALIYSDATNVYALTVFTLVGVTQIRQKSPGAGAFLLAVLSLTTAIFYWTLGQMGYFERTFLSMNAPLLGNLMEISFLTYSLTKSLEKLRNVEIEAQLETRKVTMLNRFLRLLSHDLANPIAIIEASAEGLQIPDDSLQKKKIARIARATGQLKKIIGNVRTLQALQSGKLNVQNRPTHLNFAIEEATFSVSTLSARKNVKIVIEGAEQELWVQAEPNSLTHEVLSNLLSNAIKFSPSGSSVHILIKNLGTEIKNPIELTVLDHGIGMPAATLNRIFEEGAETSRPGTEGEKGTGFGMPLVKAFVESYGGTIKITSKEKQDGNAEHGTTVTLRFVLAENRNP